MQTFKITCFTGIFIFLMSCLSMANPVTQTEKPTDNRATYAELLTKLDKDQLEDRMGRKLKFVERMVVKRLQKKIRKRIAKGKSDDKPSGVALASLILGSIAIPFVFIPNAAIGVLGLLLALAAIITGAVGRDGSGSKSDRFAKIGFWLGMSVAILLLVLILLVFTLIASTI